MFFFVYLFQFHNGRFVPSGRVLDTMLDYDTVSSVVCYMPSASLINGTSYSFIVHEPRDEKPVFAYAKIKGSAQISCAADRRLCFRYIKSTTIIWKEQGVPQ